VFNRSTLPYFSERLVMHPDVINAGVGYPPEARARRVILALAEEMPADAVDAAAKTIWGDNWRKLGGLTEQRILTVITTFLKHVAGETP
jgi:hypothetical protein